MLTTDTHDSEPGVDSIDYAEPDKYLTIADSLGTKSAIVARASELKGDTALDTLRNVLAWIHKNLKCGWKKTGAWQNYDDVLRQKAYGGCASEGLVCGVLVKGAGIPALWVKTMDVSWIWDFKRGRPFNGWSGHVFLEIFVNEQWVLLDPGAETIFKNYSPKARILPGNRFAYHKGNDPKSMIMSFQWEQWKKQTAEFFRTLDESMLPVDQNGSLKLLRQAHAVERAKPNEPPESANKTSGGDVQ